MAGSSSTTLPSAPSSSYWFPYFVLYPLPITPISLTLFLLPLLSHLTWFTFLLTLNPLLVLLGHPFLLPRSLNFAFFFAFIPLPNKLSSYSMYTLVLVLLFKCPSNLWQHPFTFPTQQISLSLFLPFAPSLHLLWKWKQRAACQNISIAIRWRSRERRQSKKMCRHICRGSRKMESSVPVAFLQSFGNSPPLSPLSLALFKSPLFEILIWHGIIYKCTAVYLYKGLALLSCPSPCCPRWSDETNAIQL